MVLEATNCADHESMTLHILSLLEGKGKGKTKKGKGPQGAEEFLGQATLWCQEVAHSLPVLLKMTNSTFTSLCRQLAGFFRPLAGKGELLCYNKGFCQGSSKLFESYLRDI